MHIRSLIIAGMLLGLGLILAASARADNGRAPAVVTATAPIGTVITTTTTISNLGQPAMTARLYEAWPPGAPAQARPARPPRRVPLPDRPGPVTSELRAQTAEHGQAEMIVYLADQADLAEAAAMADWDARGAAVVAALRAHAETSQRPLIEALHARGVAARSFWIVNALAVRGDGPLADWLAARPEVGLVDLNYVHRLDAGGEPKPAAPLTTAWGVERVRAPDVWADWGVTGQGIVVANIDTGAWVTHTALIEGYRGWSPQGLSHDYNWYDPAGDPASPIPFDPAGHGTHTLGTIAGRAAGGGPAIGVAPGVRWIAARGCGGFFCSDESLIAGAQWLLAPTDANYANPRPDLRPHIINNSWGAQGDNPWYLGYVEAWNAAGIFSVFAIGNSGFFGCGSTGAPGNYAAAFAVGATDAADLVASFSSRGPTSDGRLKPELSAPGVGVPSAWPGGAIVNQNGTSMAAPHAAGAAALLWSANPALIGDLGETRRLLTGSALPLRSAECGDAPDAIPNNVYGWGRLDAYRAVLEARVEVPWLSVPPTITLPHNDMLTVTVTLDARQVSAPGTYQARILVARGSSLTPIPVTFNVTASAGTSLLTGQLRDRWQGHGVYGRLALAEGPTVASDPGGFFTATLPNGTYALTATAAGYVPAVTPLVLVTDTLQLITLTADAPHLSLSAPALSATLPFAARQSTPITVENLGPRPLTITVAVPPTEWSVTGPISGAALYDLSAFPPLPLADDMVYTDGLPLGFAIPIYGVLTDTIWISSNGWVSAMRTTSASPWAFCPPSSSLPRFSLAPFWADHDPSQGGAVRAGAVASGTFVVSWEAVPPWRPIPDPLGPTNTFQIALHADGRVEYLYGAMEALTGYWSVGALFDDGRGQSLACYRDRPAPALAGRAWSLMNQPDPSIWLGASPATLAVPPHSSRTLTANLSGFGYVPWRTEPFAAPLRLTTNDPLTPFVDVPAQASVGPAPFYFWMPVVRR